MATYEKWAKVFKSRHQYLDNIPVQFGDAKDAAFSWDGTQLELLPVTDDTGAFNIGDGTNDFDVKVFLGTTAKYVEFNVGDVLLKLEDVDLKLGDNDSLQLGDASGGDVSIVWDGSNLVILPATDNIGTINIGNDGTKSMDVKLFGATASSYMLWDNSDDRLELDGADLNLQDSDILQFGDAQDVTMTWNGSAFQVSPATDDTGAINIGDGTKDIDVKIFLSDTAHYAEFDVGNKRLSLQGTSMYFMLGTFASATSGSGVAMTAALSQALQVYVDDGNAAIASSVLTRAGRFRNLQVYTGGNREQEAVGVIGQIVSVAGTNRHNMAGVMGSYEAITSLTVDGQAPATDPWIQAAVIGRVGVGSAITTINANGRLAGVAAMSNTASFSANNGVYTGFYAGRWGSNLDWAYGLYFENVQLGAYFNTSKTISGEEHAIDVAAAAACTSGDSFVGLNVVATVTGTAASWNSAAFFKMVQASKVTNGYLCAAEFELSSVAANASDNSVIVLNSVRNHTGSPPACDPYVLLREYGTTYANVFLRIFGDTGQGAITGGADTTLLATATADKAANCAIRCMFGSTVFWLLGTTTAPS